MEDSQIIDLYYARNEEAIAATDRKLQSIPTGQRPDLHGAAGQYFQLGRLQNCRSELRL